MNNSMIKVIVWARKYEKSFLSNEYVKTKTRITKIRKGVKLC